MLFWNFLDFCFIFIVNWIRHSLSYLVKENRIDLNIALSSSIFFLCSLAFELWLLRRLKYSNRIHKDHLVWLLCNGEIILFHKTIYLVLFGFTKQYINWELAPQWSPTRCSGIKGNSFNWNIISDLSSTCLTYF